MIAVVLFSGGLDSTLAVRILQEQGVDVEALAVKTTFCNADEAILRAGELAGARLTVRSMRDDYVDLLRNPPHGYGKACNPCLDCRAYMVKMARQFMLEVEASFVATGEILGQRPMSQKKRDLRIIEETARLEGRLLRPLSAKLLRPTIPEQVGDVDRDKLYGFSGRRRGELIELAEKFGIKNVPGPSVGCPITEKSFSPRFLDLLKFEKKLSNCDFELLNFGRHFRFDSKTKVVIGRNVRDNSALRWFAGRCEMSDAALVYPENFRGPDMLVVGNVSQEAIRFAAGMMLRYARKAEPGNAYVWVTQGGVYRRLQAREDETAMSPQGF